MSPRGQSRLRNALVGALAVACAAALARWGSATLSITFSICVLATWGLAPLVARLARTLGAIVEPGGRSFHSIATPVLGGIAVTVPILVVLCVLGLQGTTKAWGLFIGLALIFAVGVLDDLVHLRPRVKIAVQLVAAGVLLLFGFELPGLGVPGVGYAELGVLGPPLLIVWVLLATNAFNLIDGLDGLAATLAAMAGLGLVIPGVHPLIAVALGGACIGFLAHNLPTARLFLGDSGSLAVGFLMAALVLELPAASNLPFAVALMAYPVGDVALAFLRRLVRSKPLLAGDASHVHHKVALHMHGDAPALVTIAAFAFALMVVGLLRPSLLSLGLTFVAWLGAAIALMVAGRFRLRYVLAARRPFRRLHVCARYGEAMLRMAQSRSDLDQALLHCAEALGLGSIAIPALDVEIRSRHGDRPPLASHARRVQSLEVHWSTPLPRTSEAFERERETVLLGLLRLTIRCFETNRRMLDPRKVAAEGAALSAQGAEGVSIQ